LDLPNSDNICYELFCKYNVIEDFVKAIWLFGAITK